MSDQGQPQANVGSSAFNAFADSTRRLVKVTAIKALQPKHGATLIRIDTDAGISGFGPCIETGPVARSVIDKLHHGRLPHLGLIGKDPLDIQVHFHNMFYAYPQRGRTMPVLSGIDIALWDLAGKLLGQPVCKLLGGTFRQKIALYSHCPQGDFLDKVAWKDRAQQLLSDPHGFKAFKVDIHSALGTHMQEYLPSISLDDARKVNRAYSMAREALGSDIDIIVHCHNELDLSSAIKVAAAVEPIKPLFFEDPIAPGYSEAWNELRRATRLPILTGENIELAENALPFILNQTVDCLQPDLINSGGITGTKVIADIAALFRVPICLHNVSGYALTMASQQFSAAIFNCPMMECTRDADIAPECSGNLPVITEGCMQVSMRPGLGVELDQGYLKSTRNDDEPWWD